ncbi:MAG: carboxypeptidase M32 [candidate division WOR-3 bacterium]|nr:carboxypeptidase M32 [candidate division WOR-3 bacterium]MCX7948178.1 carboxypeptidase M32 [candidate division WOR-3 bacterium]MDW8151126.1 carboxypeptidase M32 [candidate division WOR-3 bacterium]
MNNLTPKQAYEKLYKISKRLAYFSSVLSILGWDERTYIPKSGYKYRSELNAVLGEYIHDEWTKDYIGELIEIAKNGELNEIERSNLYWWERSYIRSKKIPKELLINHIKVSTVAYQVWKEAREKSDFELFKPYLNEIVKILREKVQILGYKNEPYDALLDGYEAEITAEEISKVFEELKGETIRLLEKVKEKDFKRRLINGHFEKEKQKSFCIYLLEKIGFDFSMGRIDETTHPFATRIHPGDIRITTRFYEDNILSSIFGTLHEMGHAFYEMGLKEEYFGTPVGEAVSLGIHESQSRFWENIIGRSLEFWELFYKDLRRYFMHFENIKLEHFYLAINEIKPSYIRVEADELTYNLHIILRFELERDLINGKLSIDDVKDAWNEKFESLFGFRPRNDSEGILQDVHWSSDMGYFPTYTLGNLNAAQFLYKINKDLGNIYELVKEGNFKTIYNWLKENIYEKGSLYKPQELLEKVTGERTNPKYFLKYIEDKIEKLLSID